MTIGSSRAYTYCPIVRILAKTIFSVVITINGNKIRKSILIVSFTAVAASV